MKKYIGIALAVLMVLGFSRMALAGDTTVGVDVGNASSVNTFWNGTNGTFTLNGQLGNTLGNSADVNVWNGGGAFSGNANLANTGFYPNPVSGNYIAYTESYLNAQFTGGGYAQFDATRNLSYPGYGPAGQCVFGGVSSNDTGQLSSGSISTAYGISTSYAQMYVFNTQFQATGTGSLVIDPNTGAVVGPFSIRYGLTNGANGAGLSCSGTGFSQVSNGMYSSAGGSYFTFGSGGGCHTNATVNATGSGQFVLGGQALNNLNAPGFAVAIIGGGNFQYVANYNTGLFVSDFSVQGN
ncbi:hypothetical protein ES703_35954 [subsurface metagenome]